MEDTSNLTKAQMLFWAGQKLLPETPHYNMAVNIAIDGEVDPDRFERALRKVVTRCDALMSVFEDEEASMPRRRVDGELAWTLEHVNFSGEPDPEGAARAWAERRCGRIFDLNRSLFDTALLKTRPGRHIWYLNQHHLVTDAWSTSVLFRQVAESYEHEEYEPKLPAYDDYVAFERSARHSPDYAAVAGHWERKCRRAAPPPRLYGIRAGGTSTVTERIRVDFGQERSDRLRAVSMDENVRCLTPHLTFFNLFSTFLFAFLYRISGQRELAIGAPAHNRPTRQFKETVGVFIELYPLFTEISAEDTFQMVFDKVKVETAEFLRYARPGACDPSYNMGINAVLNYINASFGTFSGMATETDWVHCGHGDRGHHLRLQVYDFDAAGRFILEFDLNAEVFDREHRERACGHFLKLVDAFLEDRSCRVDGVDVLGEEERRELIVDYNKASPESPVPDRTVVALFAERVAAAPERAALVYEGSTMSFGELKGRAGKLAAALDVEGKFVGVCMRRSPELVVAVLAILEAGAAFVPLDPANPASRLRGMVEDSGVDLVVTARRYRPLLEGLEDHVTVLEVDALGVHGAAPASGEGLDRSRLEALAYMIYTSGSTGQPKGVPIEHRGLADYLTWAARHYVRGDRLTFPLFTSLGFDLTITSLFLPLITGGTLVIYEEDGDGADTSIANVIRENAVDFIKLTPSHLSLVSQMELPDVPRITRMVLGGEDFKTALARRILERWGGGLEIYNEYGPTEAVVGCMIHRFDPLEDTSPSVPIGVPAHHVQVYVLDRELRPVPAGVPGELCISRHGLAREYYGNPALTGERFVPHPFREGDILYRSGDLARFHRRGSLEFIGRIDRQLKAAGHRVEPGEVEVALESHPSIDKALVMMVAAPDRPGVAAGSDGIRYCEKCGIPSNYPEVSFDEENVCGICREFASYQKAAADYFKPMEELKAFFEESRRRRPGKFDCMVLLSGGKDSTYALCRLVGMGLAVYAFSLDNGYISDEAKANIRAVVDSLGVKHEFATTPAMATIFQDSLTRFSNVCNGCFKALYTLSINRALDLGISIIVTGLSRGQFFETRLSPGLFRASGGCSPEQVDAAVLEARKVYHRLDDAVSRSLDVRHFQSDAVFDAVRVVDFYRYCDVGVDELMGYLAVHSPWKRPSDTGRSTNCRINDVGIYIHNKERGYHNYALPYSWDVRMGHKTRQQAIDELNDEIDVAEVRRMLSEVGYDEDQLSQGGGSAGLFVAFYTGKGPVGEADLRNHLANRVPPAMIPARYRHIEEMPLNRNGKVDPDRLPAFDWNSETGDGGDPAQGELERQIAEIWAAVLKIPEPAATANFFSLGGASLPAMEVMLRICRQFGVSLALSTVFQHPTVRQLASLVEEAVLSEIEHLSDDQVAALLQKG